MLVRRYKRLPYCALILVICRIVDWIAPSCSSGAQFLAMAGDMAGALRDIRISSAYGGMPIRMSPSEMPRHFADRALRVSALKGLGEESGYTIYPWVRSRELIGAVRLCLRDRSIQVSYQERDSHTRGMLLEQTVVLEVTRCTYGGKRYWFRCPTCNRRATTLFVVGPPFGCRVCMGLAYDSQRESALDRTRRRAMRVQRRSISD
jgi:hypothetical protein